MKFDLWTFAFQIINFTVLLFILKRLLYKPIREIMEKRRALAVKTMEEAEAARKQAESLKLQSQSELAQLHEQRCQLEEQMKAEVAQQRTELLEEAARQGQLLMDKERALFAAEKRHYGTQIREQAIEAVGLFAANICRDLADEGLHQALCRRLLNDMERIAAELRKASTQEASLKVEVSSAYPLTGEEEHSLHDALEIATGRQVDLNTTLDRELVAGLKLRVFDLIFDSSLSGQVAALTARLKESA